MNAQHEETPAPTEITENIVRRFWRCVEISEDSKCWLWKGNRDRYGYGQFSIGNHPYRAHRVAYWLWNAKWFAPSVKLRHSCDVRACCNPAHLIPGTQADNMRDRRLREGYRTMAKGERHGLSKLRAEHVRAIRNAAPYPGVVRDLAGRYGVGTAQISRIRSGKVWKWQQQETTPNDCE